MNRWLAALPAALLLGLVAVGGLQLSRGDQTAQRFVGDMRPAPVLALPTLSGGEAAYPGVAEHGPRLVNFWATWCAPCAVEHPILLEMAAAGVAIDGILYKDDPDAAAGALANAGDPFTRVPIDASGDAGIAFGVAGVPETFLIDADGRIARIHRGALDEAAAAEFIAAFKAAKAAGG